MDHVNGGAAAHSHVSFDDIPEEASPQPGFEPQRLRTRVESFLEPPTAEDLEERAAHWALLLFARFSVACPTASDVARLLWTRAARDFFTTHLAYFIGASFTAAAIVSRLDGYPYADSLVLCVGAMTGPGTTPVDVTTLSTGSLVILWFLMTFGGVTLTGLWAMCYRLHAWRFRLLPSLRRVHRLSRALRRLVRARGSTPPSAPRDGHGSASAAPSDQPFAKLVRAGSFNWSAYEAGSLERAAQVLDAIDAAGSDVLLADLAQQDEGLEAVAVATAAYTLLFQIATPLILWGSIRVDADPALAAALGGTASRVKAGWFSMLMSTSAFNNVGFSPLGDNAAQLAGNQVALLVLAAASLAGNTLWPIALRGMLRAASRRSRGARFALAHPQQCYHLLFGPPETAVLAYGVVVMNVFQLVVLLGTSGTAAVLRAGRSAAHAACVAFFTVVQSRSTGFQLFNLNYIAPVNNVVTIFFMWFSAYPLIVLWAREAEGSAAPAGVLPGALGECEDDTSELEAKDARKYPVLNGFRRRYLGRHATWIYLSFFAIAAAEVRLLQAAPGDASPPKSTLFEVLFEVISCYGTNGMSLGPFPESLNAFFTTFSKLVLVFLMLLGRHRSMPRRIDPLLSGRRKAAHALVDAAREELRCAAKLRGMPSGLAASPAPGGQPPAPAVRHRDALATALALLRGGQPSDETHERARPPHAVGPHDARLVYGERECTLGGIWFLITLWTHF